MNEVPNLSSTNIALLRKKTKIIIFLNWKSVPLFLYSLHLVPWLSNIDMKFYYRNDDDSVGERGENKKKVSTVSSNVTFSATDIEHFHPLISSLLTVGTMSISIAKV